MPLSSFLQGHYRRGQAFLPYVQNSCMSVSYLLTEKKTDIKSVKCNMMQLTNKRINKIETSYTLEGTVLENVNTIALNNYK